MPAARARSPKRTTKRPPSDAGRNTERIQVSVLPSEKAEIDSIALRLAPPGRESNRSGAIVAMARWLLNMEALGLVAIDDQGIRLRGGKAGGP